MWVELKCCIISKLWYIRTCKECDEPKYVEEKIRRNKDKIERHK
jgi:hypothetical protein